MSASAAARDDLTFYDILRRLPLGRSYVLRLFLVCFVGTHVPLVAFTVTVLLGGAVPLEQSAPALITLLVATLVGTGMTLVAVRAALAPIVRSIGALRAYNTARILPDLPLRDDDEASELMATVRIVCERLEVELRRREHQASTDALTGLANRMGFFDGSVRILNAARRAGTETALVLFDIDRFKSINDTFGHPAGDAVIAAVAGIIADVAGEGAFAGRLGGEEFALLLPCTDAAAARDVAERVRAAVARLEVEACPGRAITISGGFTALDVFREPGLDGAIERADRALYAAKEGGRDRIVDAVETGRRALAAL
ncbi:GGDEF domain-containing protein [Salinarimonas ramus]|uniref:diguanylate cyclase n=1 Tax=Salinarimonas ramus TaxID=690164 RepID=A0A917Q546_9HYPH|nr:GGDEF domain-containing protein [Salinarimonas ramus]GGK24007.1 hypothetical protein GCM10011322_08320 [Salinarimonas ramus]